MDNALLAEMALRDLHNRYAYTIDQGILDDIVALFTDDCVITKPDGTSMAGTKDIRAHYERMLRQPGHRFHLLTSMVVRMAEDLQSGEITSLFFALVQGDGETPRIATGQLIDEAVKQNSTWRIRARSIDLHLTA